MSLKIIVLAKQVPDTRNVGPDAMTAEGTVNRAALPAVFNPDDLNALEMALWLKDRYEEAKIMVLTMGLPKSAEVVRESLYRGADEGFVVTDRCLGGADTLATSYTLAQAIKKVGEFDLVLCGRQAIDGDTAQVGPQVAEKLGLTQVTYAEKIISLDKKNGHIVVRRKIDGGVETVEAPLPVVLTVNDTAHDCRPRDAKRLMAYKHFEPVQWSAQDIDADLTQVGSAGSPTNVKSVQNIVFKAKEKNTLTADDADVESLIVELLNEKIIG